HGAGGGSRCTLGSCRRGNLAPVRRYCVSGLVSAQRPGSHILRRNLPGIVGLGCSAAHEVALNIRTSDYLLVRLAELAGTALRGLGNLETQWLRPRLRNASIDAPVFIAGLARSGTT